MSNGEPTHTNGNRDNFFLKVLMLFGSMMVIFALIAVIHIVWGDPSEKVAFRLINAMGAMFTGMLGLALGYLSGRG